MADPRNELTTVALPPHSVSDTDSVGSEALHTPWKAALYTTQERQTHTMTKRTDEPKTHEELSRIRFLSQVTKTPGAGPPMLHRSKHDENSCC